jgi:hypothetical protein
MDKDEPRAVRQVSPQRAFIVMAFALWGPTYEKLGARYFSDNPGTFLTRWMQYDCDHVPVGTSIPIVRPKARLSGARGRIRTTETSGLRCPALARACPSCGRGSDVFPEISAPLDAQSPPDGRRAARSETVSGREGVQDVSGGVIVFVKRQTAGQVECGLRSRQRSFPDAFARRRSAGAPLMGNFTPCHVRSALWRWSAAT